MTDHIAPTMTPAEFMATPQPDEGDPAFDFRTLTDGPDFGPGVNGVPLAEWVRGGSPEPYPSVEPEPGGIAGVLARLDYIVALIEEPLQLRADLAQTQARFEIAVEASEIYRTRIADTLDAIKKSTSKVAKDVRAILEPEPLAPAPTDPTPETPAGGQAADAPYPSSAPEVPAAPPAGPAPDERDLGHHGPDQRQPQPSTEDTPDTWRAYAVSCGVPEAEAAKLNRSQIRTRLGITQPTPGQEG